MVGLGEPSTASDHMRIAIFSDIRANLSALQAVLADMDASGVDAAYVLGDLVGYAPWPDEVPDRLVAESLPIPSTNWR